MDDDGYETGAAHARVLVEGKMTPGDLCSHCIHERENQTCVIMLYTARGAVNQCKGLERQRAETKILTPQVKPAIIEDKQRVFLMTLRQATIMLLGGLEDLLEMKRSIPKRKR